MKSIIMPLNRAIKMIDKAVEQKKPINQKAWQSVRIALYDVCDLYEKCNVKNMKNVLRKELK
jgi:hypothetical protein